MNDTEINTVLAKYGWEYDNGWHFDGCSWLSYVLAQSATSRREFRLLELYPTVVLIEILPNGKQVEAVRASIATNVDIEKFFDEVERLVNAV